MSNNDNKIKELLAQIDKKKSALGDKPKAHLKSNGVLKLSGKQVNIHTINTINACVLFAAEFVFEKQAHIEACKFLEVSEQSSERITQINEYLDDLKLRVKIINWEADKIKLDAMVSKLKDLRSEDAKTADALDDISKALE